MIKVEEATGGRAGGFNVVRSVILSRVEENLIETRALDMLVEKTGGVLRHAFEVLHTVATMSDISTPVGIDEIRYGLGRLRKELARQIALPHEPLTAGPQSVYELYDRLAEYARNQVAGARTIPISDTTNQLLLRSCALPTG